jgi:hypothetical protein
MLVRSSSEERCCCCGWMIVIEASKWIGVAVVGMFFFVDLVGGAM